MLDAIITSDVAVPLFSGKNSAVVETASWRTPPATAAFIKKGLKEINVLILYPLISTIMLLLCYFIQAPFICLIGGFVIGYAGAGGVLQLAVSTTAEFFPENKGTATSLVMIASSIANYTI